MKHPSEIISDFALNTLRDNANSSEEMGCLTTEDLTLIYENKWLQILEPKSIGGLEWPLPKVVQLFEALAWADANVGWTVNLCAGANMFSGYLDTKTAKNLFINEKICCAGSGAVSGIARKFKSGFLVSGKWKYASGAAHASYFTGNCFLLDEHNQPLLKEGEKVFRSFLFPKEKVILKNTWNAIGLKATSSDDFEIKDLFVPETHTFSLLKSSEYTQSTLFRFPFLTLAIVNIACMPVGIALHFIDLFKELTERKKPIHDSVFLKDNKQVKLIFEQVTHAFNDARNEMYINLEQVWSNYQKEELSSKILEDKLASAAKNAAEKARNLVTQLFPLCGMDILYLDAPLNKVWRDMVTASQHFLLSPLNKD